MAYDINQIVLSGTLLEEPQQRSTPNGSILTECTLRVEQTAGGKTKQMNVSAVFWGKLSDMVMRMCHTGSWIVVSGKLWINEFRDSRGDVRMKAEMNAYSFISMDERGGNSGRSFPGSGSVDNGQRQLSLPDFTSKETAGPPPLPSFPSNEAADLPPPPGFQKQDEDEPGMYDDIPF